MEADTFVNLFHGQNLLTTIHTPPVINPKVRHWSKIAIFSPVGESLSEYCRKV